jgi:hypothetical protein
MAFNRKERCVGMSIAKIAGIAAALAIAAGLVMSWPDLRRYIKIESM